MDTRPMIFSAPMVRAILAGTKTQTRRVVKIDAVIEAAESFCEVLTTRKAERLGKNEIGVRAVGFMCKINDGFTLDDAIRVFSPYGQPGDRVWVRETWAIEDERALVTQRKDAVIYLATHSGDRPWRGRPAIHMPRWASRITLEIVSVRVERLQEISEADAIAEGAEVWSGKETPWKGVCAPVIVHGYATLWESINGAGSWDANPWVWVIEFRRVQP